MRKSLKRIPPGPSSPASIPSTRNTSSSGAPMREAPALATMLNRNSSAATKMI
jgi:hypothetical protein